MDSVGRKVNRPARRTNRKSLPTGFVDTVDALGDDLGEEFIPTSDSDDGLPPPVKARPTKKQKLQGTKRSRHPFNSQLSPKIEPLSPQVRGEFAEAHSLDLSELKLPSVKLPNTLAITLNVPSNNRGPFTLNLDIASILQYAQTQESASRNGKQLTSSKPKRKPAVKMEVAPFKCESEDEEACGWSNLPAELRNKIYDLVFAPDPTSVIAISESTHSKTTNKTKSAQFLRTCKQVHAEGSQILYSANSFRFERQHAVRGHYYNPQWHEIGYKDCRQFLEDIGSLNISYMREIHIKFDDGKPSHNPADWQSDDVRFVYDEHLMACLRLLGEHGNIKHLKLSFAGRRETTREDVRFLHNLQKLRADKVTIDATKYGPYYGGHSPVNSATELWVKEKIERSEPLYLEKKRNKGRKLKKRKAAEM